MHLVNLSVWCLFCSRWKVFFTFALCLLYSWYHLVIVSLLFAHMIFAAFLNLSCIMIFRITRHAIYTKQISTTLVSSHCISERWCRFLLFFFKKKNCSFFAGGVNNVFIKYDWFISLLTCLSLFVLVLCFWVADAVTEQ